MAEAPPAAAPKPPTTKPGVPEGNPALRMMGLPNLPRKLPSRNWLIFWAITGSFTAAIVYDKREKNRATAKWRHAVEHLSKETINSPNQLPRKLTIYIESAPGDGLRSAQDHFIEYAKPVFAASGLDWEFVQGRQQGDVRAAVAEKIRRTRKAAERPAEEQAATEDNVVEQLRQRIGIPQYEGVKGDVVIGRHAWKEYIRGLHEGWLGPLDAPPSAIPAPEPPKPTPDDQQPKDNADGTEQPPTEEKKEEEKKDEKPKRPPQPLPYNTPDSYSESTLPPTIPAEFAPSTTLQFPHRLGFSSTFIRLGWFLNRRKLADDIGREVAAVCFAASRGYHEQDGEFEQQNVLKKEEQNWPKSVFKDEPPSEDADEAPKPPKEKIWASHLNVDARLMERMRRFELLPEDEARAAKIKVPESEIEGWIKGSFRSLINWGVGAWTAKPWVPNVGNVDDE